MDERSKQGIVSLCVLVYIHTLITFRRVVNTSPSLSSDLPSSMSRSNNAPACKSHHKTILA